jgi:MerR family transcriptional regulator/heat shock protein HspR
MADGDSRSPEQAHGRRRDRAVFVISVAAELAGVHPQTLRIYERKGLVRPKRTLANSRRYSERDIDRLREIQDLTAQGVNLAGVRRIMELDRQVAELEAKLEALKDELRSQQARHRDELETVRRAGRRELVLWSPQVLVYEPRGARRPGPRDPGATS